MSDEDTWKDAFLFWNKRYTSNLYDKESVTLEMQRPKQAPMTC